MHSSSSSSLHPFEEQRDITLPLNQDSGDCAGCTTAKVKISFFSPMCAPGAESHQSGYGRSYIIESTRMPGSFIINDIKNVHAPVQATVGVMACKKKSNR